MDFLKLRIGLHTQKWGRFEFRTDVDWLKRLGIRGVVIGRRLYFAEPAHLIPEFVFRHELEHAYQQIREGRLRFYLKYLYYSLRYGYEKNPFEVEARERALYPLTAYEDEVLCKLKDGCPPLPNGSLPSSK